MMKVFLIVVLSIISSYQVETACLDDLLKLFTFGVTKTEEKMNITVGEIVSKIETTKETVDAIIQKSKQTIKSEKEKLLDLEITAYGKSLEKKKSITDCLQKNRVKMNMINKTESVIYSVCRADLSLFLVKLSIGSVNSVSRELQKNLDICMNTDVQQCEKEITCIINALKQAQDELNWTNSDVEKKLDNILNTSQICADGKRDIVISMIREQENKFNYCVDQILNDNQIYIS